MCAHLSEASSSPRRSLTELIRQFVWALVSMLKHNNDAVTNTLEIIRLIYFLISW